MYREFTKSDWAGWAGATTFRGGKTPIIGEQGDYLVVAGGEGVEVYFCGVETTFALHHESKGRGDLMSQRLAGVIADAILREAESIGPNFDAMIEYLRDLGFVQIG